MNWTRLATACLLAARVVAQAPPSDGDCDTLAQQLRSENIQVRNEAALALAPLGPRGACAVEALRVIVREEPEDLTSVSAIDALGQIGAAAVSAAPDLMEAALHKMTARQALDALPRLGPGVIPYVLPWLDIVKNPVTGDDVRETFELASIVLGKVGRPAIPFLIEAMKTPSRRKGAADALGDIGSEAGVAVPALIETLHRDQDPYVRFSIVKALGQIGPGARQAIPVLERVASGQDGSGDESLKEDAQRALARIRAAAPK
jgi:HEAT repeat protein